MFCFMGTHPKGRDDLRDDASHALEFGQGFVDELMARVWDHNVGPLLPPVASDDHL